MSTSDARERHVFAAAVALITLHVVTDAFLAPEPGTGGGDHLVPALVPLALLTLAVWADWRARAGVRAAIALLLAPLALVGAGVELAEARAIGFEGDAWTGLGLAAAGVALLALGLWLLWRSRKPGRWRYVRRAGIAAVAVVATYVLVVPVAVAIVATHRPRAEVGAAGARASHGVHARNQRRPRLAAWYAPSRTALR